MYLWSIALRLYMELEDQEDGSDDDLLSEYLRQSGTKALIMAARNAHSALDQ